MTDEVNRKRIDFEKRITNAALESELELSVVIKSLSAVQHRFSKVKESLADKTNVRKAAEYAEHDLFVDQGDYASSENQHFSFQPLIEGQIPEGQSDYIINEQIKKFEETLDSIARNQSNIC